MIMKLEQIGEFGFIRKISKGCLVRETGVVKGIGDDAAAFTMPGDEWTLITTDLLVEGIHFLRGGIGGFDLGYRSLAVSLSDIAAMGGTPMEAFVSIAVPGSCDMAFLVDFYDGLKSLGSEFGVNILGGDTSGSKRDLVINLTVAGSVPPDEMLSRNGAKPGDRICCTGNLGDSRAGLYLTLNQIDADTADLKRLRTAHVRPRPNVREGRFLAERKGATAAIDISDGLSSDLLRIAESSRVGARIQKDQLPVSGPLSRFCRRFGFDAFDYALTGGEDYSLLLTISSDHLDAVSREYQNRFGAPLYPIGEVTASGKMEVIDRNGQSRKIEPAGWNHFI